MIDAPEHIKAAEIATRELNAALLTVMLLWSAQDNFEWIWGYGDRFGMRLSHKPGTLCARHKRRRL